MNTKILIDSIVRQTTVLIAQLATAGGVRAPLAHLANQVFLELSRELDAQGVSRKVSADMFGLALRSYLRKVRWLTESATDRNTNLWEAVLGFIREADVRTRAEVLKRFARDDETLVKAVIRDLIESGLVSTSGRGTRRVLRWATETEQRRMLEDGAGFDELIWVVIYCEGPVKLSTLREFTASNPELLDATLARLLQWNRIEALHNPPGDVQYRAVRFEVFAGSEAGWEAAIYDHYQALVRTVCQRITQGACAADDPSKVRGGSTFTFDVWPGHPMEREVYASLPNFRAQYTNLYDRIEAYNAEHGRPEEYTRVTLYSGQSMVVESTNTEEGIT